jgi:aminoglycoside phosphotransferase
MDHKIENLLKSLEISEDDFIGAGGMGRVYKYEGDKIIKIFSEVALDSVKGLKDMYDLLHKNKSSLTFDIPYIYSVNKSGEMIYTIEKRLDGIHYTDIENSLSESEKHKFIENYLLGAGQIQRIKLEDLPYGDILNDWQQITSASWSEYLKEKTVQRLKYSEKFLLKEFPNFSDLVNQFMAKLGKLSEPDHKSVVHGDYFLNNILFDDKYKIKALLDFNPLTVMGDWKMDIVGAVIFLQLFESISHLDYQYAYKKAVELYGENLLEVFDTYKLFYSFYFGNMYEDDRKLYDWSVKNIKKILVDQVNS